MFKNLLKIRSPFGKFLDRNDISQEAISRISGVNRDTVSKAANMKTYKPNLRNAKKLVNACRKWEDKITLDDFWYFD